MDVKTALRSAGFQCVFQYQETTGGDAKGRQVEKGVPMTYDYNNGVVVVYDQDGFPWVAPINYLERFEGRDQLRRGADVPFSKDGGHRIRKMFPEAFGERRYQ